LFGDELIAEFSGRESAPLDRSTVPNLRRLCWTERKAIGRDLCL
jgi:hypothetical protein